MPQTNVGDLDDQSANGIWEAYLDDIIGDNRTNATAIRDAQRLVEADKGDYELATQMNGVPVWNSPEGQHYTYDVHGLLQPWKADNPDR